MGFFLHIQNDTLLFWLERCLRCSQRWFKYALWGQVLFIESDKTDQFSGMRGKYPGLEGGRPFLSKYDIVGKIPIGLSQLLTLMKPTQQENSWSQVVSMKNNYSVSALWSGSLMTKDLPFHFWTWLPTDLEQTLDQFVSVTSTAPRPGAII